jgi:hypothetical protein
MKALELNAKAEKLVSELLDDCYEKSVSEERTVEVLKAAALNNIFSALVLIAKNLEEMNERENKK